MLADVSEAVTHSMKNPSEAEVDSAIDKVFQNRWDDGQFGESGLSYNEMQRVKKAFVRVWRTLHHDRLKYPSTTTGRMPVVPKDLPTAASRTQNEIPALPVIELDDDGPGGCCGTIAPEDLPDTNGNKTDHEEEKQPHVDAD
jgi:hypothetical protein